MPNVAPWPYELPYLLSLVVTAWLAAVVANRPSAGAMGRSFVIWLAAESAWTLGYLFELRAPDLATKLFWDNCEWLPAPVMTAAMTAFAYRFTGGDAQARRMSVLALVTTLATTACMLYGAVWGGLRDSARIENSDTDPALIYDFTDWDNLVVLTSYAWLVANTLRLWRARRTQTELARRQTNMVLLGFLVPALFGLSGLTPLRPFGQRDATPLGFALGALLVFWSIRRHQLFDVLPVARVAVLEAIPDPVIVLDGAQRIVDANAAARTWAGGAELSGAPFARAFPALAELPDRADEPNQPIHDPSGRSLVARLVPVPDERGRRRATAIVLRDVTESERLNRELEERVRARTAELTRSAERLRESEAKLRAVFNGTRTLIGLLDVEGRVSAANRTALELVGVTEAAVLGRPFEDSPWWSHDPNERQKLVLALAEARNGRTSHFETTHRNVAGELRAIDFVLTPHRDERNEVVWMIPEGRDVTELKESERQQQNLAKRLEHGERLESLGRLAGGVAHDFNNLLTVITNAASLLGEEPALGPAAHALIEDILAATGSAASLTRQLLTFGKQPAGETEILDVDQKLASLTDLLRRLTGDGVTLDVQPGAERASVRLNGGHYEQILINLVMNAQQALGGRGVIRVTTTVGDLTRTPDDAVGPLPKAGRYVSTAVTDDGPGIPPDALDHVFEPFYTTKPSGTGLGLSTVYALTTRAGGCVSVRSTPGTGTTLTVHLPEVAPAPARTDRARRTPSEHRHRILLVDDDPRVRSVLFRLLERLGQDVTAVDGGASALEELGRTTAFDVLVSDVSMPGMSGVELVREAWRVRPGLPVVFMSAHPPGSELAPLLAAGARFVQKPFDAQALLSAIAAR
jgi:PAS domain S-box-containing protein